MGFFVIWTWKFSYTPGTKNVPHQSRSYNPKVQIFSINNNWVIKFKKMTPLFFLGTLFLKRTASEKMFLKRTVYIKYIEKKFFLVNECFYDLNLKFFLCLHHKKCSLIDVTLTSSGSTQTEFLFFTKDINSMLWNYG
jgi:hypothetical protein